MEPRDKTAAEPRFAEYLERLEAGDKVDFAMWAAEQGELRAELLRIHRQWLSMSSVFESLAGEVRAAACADGPEAESASLSRLLDRLRAGGDRQARYAVGAEVARGSMGRIVVAWDTELRREVALKVERDDASERTRRRFVEEAQIAAQLDHPGIVPVHELGLDADGRPFFAMRLVRGKHLGEVLDLVRAGRDGWSLTRVLHLLMRVCEAMAYAHHRGVVHRDLKPANVMIGEFGETYVMDWGLARVDGRAPLDTVRGEIAAETADSALLTHAGDVVGTPAYMAPEQATGGAAAATAAVDVYALGAILYHLLAGAPPFAGPTGASSRTDAVLAALRAGPPPPLPDGAPAELRAICERAMARAPADRYASMAALADDLRAFLENRVVAAHATGAFAELRKWVQRNRAIAWSAAAFVVLLMASVFVTSRLWLDADAARGVAATTAEDLGRSLEKSRFRNARLALRLDNSSGAQEELREQHLAGTMPRATHWALHEFAERSPLLAIAGLDAADVAFRRANGTLLLLRRTGEVTEVDATTLQPLRHLADRPVRARVIAYAAAGDLCAVGDGAGGITLWDLARGEVRRRLQSPCNAVSRMAWTADGATLYAAGDERVCRVPRDGEPALVAEPGEAVTSLCCDASGMRLWIGTTAGRLLEHRDGSAPRVLDLGGSRLLTIAVRAGGRELWVGGTSHSVCVVDAETLRVQRTFTSRNGSVREIVALPGGDMLVGGWWRIDRFTRDEDAGRAIGLLGAWRVDYDATARRLAITQQTGEVAVLDCSGRDLRELPGTELALAGNGSRVFTLRGRQLVVRDVATGAVLAQRDVGKSGQLCTDGEGRYVAIVRPGPLGVRVVDTVAGEHLFDCDGATENPFHASTAFAPGGAELAVVVGDDLVRRLALPGGAVVAQHVVPGGKLIRITYSQDGSHLALLSRGRRSVQVLRLADGACRDFDFGAELPADVDLACVALDATAERLAVGSWNGRAFVRDLRTGGERELFAHLGAMWSMAFSPADPDLFVTSSGAGGLTFWDLATGEACYQPTHLAGPVSDVQLSRDGGTLACIADGRSTLLDLEYLERHVAGLTASWLAAAPAGQPAAARAQQLRDEIRAAGQRAWPRWR